jgi:hypothetical protein
VTRRAKILLFLTVALALIAVVVISRIRREPSYEGRTLSIWMAMYKSGWDEDKDAPITRAQVAVAIRGIGIKAIPTMLNWLSNEPHRGGIPRIVDRLPIIGPAYVGNIMKNQKNAYAAADFFRIMEMHAAPAIPELTRMATKHRNVDVRNSAAHALADIGEEALPGVAAFLKTPEDPERRHFAFRLLVDERLKSYTNSSVLVQPLIDCTASHDSEVAIHAMQILRKLPVEPKVLLVALTNALRSGDKEIRREAFIHCWRLGYTEAAGIALSDPDHDVRTTATNLGASLIAPQKETNQTTSPR